MSNFYACFIAMRERERERELCGAERIKKMQRREQIRRREARGKSESKKINKIEENHCLWRMKTNKLLKNEGKEGEKAEKKKGKRQIIRGGRGSESKKKRKGKSLSFRVESKFFICLSKNGRKTYFILPFSAEKFFRKM